MLLALFFLLRNQKRGVLCVCGMFFETRSLDLKVWEISHLWRLLQSGGKFSLRVVCNCRYSSRVGFWSLERSL